MYVLICTSKLGKTTKRYDNSKTSHERAIRAAKRFAIKYLDSHKDGDAVLYGYSVNERYTVKDLEELKDTV